jgi:hypothetical protein
MQKKTKKKNQKNDGLYSIIPYKHGTHAVCKLKKNKNMDSVVYIYIHGSYALVDMDVDHAFKKGGRHKMLAGIKRVSKQQYRRQRVGRWLHHITTRSLDHAHSLLLLFPWGGVRKYKERLSTVPLLFLSSSVSVEVSPCSLIFDFILFCFVFAAVCVFVHRRCGSFPPISSCQCR